METKRMVLTSTDSANIHIGNKPHDFRVHLNTPLLLDGSWTVSLLEFSIKPKIKLKNPPDVMVFSNLCNDSIVGDGELPLLRRFYLGTQRNIIFTLPYEMPVRLGHVQDVHLYIKGANMKDASFMKGTVSVTVLLKKRFF